MDIRLLSVTVVLALQGASCGQVRRADTNNNLPDRVALRIAKDMLIMEIFNAAKRRADPDPVIMPLEEGLEWKVARLLVVDSGYGKSFYDPKLLQLSAELLDQLVPIVAAKDSLLIGDTSFWETFLKDRAERERRYVNSIDEEEKRELALNDSLTPEEALLIKQTAQKMPALRNQQTMAVLEKIRVAAAEGIRRHPEYLKLFAQERSTSPALQASRAKVQKLLQSARPRE